MLYLLCSAVLILSAVGVSGLVGWALWALARAAWQRDGDARMLLELLAFFVLLFAVAFSLAYVTSHPAPWTALEVGK
jgi:hypothetical protein